MGVAPGKPFLYLGESCSEPVCHGIAGGTACIYTRRDPGKAGNNEDSGGLIACDRETGVLAVADGVGGVAGGGKASAAAIAELAGIGERCSAGGAAREVILDAIERANRAILDMGTGCATTLIAVEVDHLQIRSYHAGDSVALVVGQRGKIKYQNTPHSPVGYAVESGLMEAREAMTHDERHIISNFLGSADMHLEIGSPFNLAKRDTLVLGSDGLYDNLAIEEIAGLVRCGPLDRCARDLAAACADRMIAREGRLVGKPDDLTFILYRPG